jgi:hypothetical protein
MNETISYKQPLLAICKLFIFNIEIEDILLIIFGNVYKKSPRADQMGNPFMKS